MNNICAASLCLPEVTLWCTATTRRKVECHSLCEWESFSKIFQGKKARGMPLALSGVLGEAWQKKKVVELKQFTEGLVFITQQQEEAFQRDASWVGRWAHATWCSRLWKEVDRIWRVGGGIWIDFAKWFPSSWLIYLS